ncbi:MAG: cupredoxin domain-containing protein [Candidatus Moraniibacteriota bacterium]
MVKIIVGVLIILGIGVYFFTRSTSAPAPAMEAQPVTESAGKAMTPAKEFSMTSYYDDKGSWFSLKEMSVKKGDLIRVKVTNTKGTHDFTLDEFGVKKQTPLNEETVIEFTAAKVGTFEYYCSMPGHRARGQWGKLIVTE